MNSILEQFSLTGQSAVITGGNQGLGLVIAQALAEAGADVAIVSRNAEKSQQSANEITERFGTRCMSLTCDVTDEEQVKKAVASAAAAYGRIDILINSAGINRRGNITELSLKDFRETLDTNLTGTWLMCREVIPHMKKRDYGRIVNLGSMLSVVSISGRTPYASSKGGVLQLTRTLALELARDGITANAILPGPFATEMNLSLTNDKAKYQEFISKIPMGRWGELHEIGGIALFLASPASGYVTGAGFSVDGGWTAQ